MDFCQEKERSHVRKKELYDELTRLTAAVADLCARMPEEHGEDHNIWRSEIEI